MRIKDWKHSQTNKECLLWLDQDPRKGHGHWENFSRNARLGEDVLPPGWEQARRTAHGHFWMALKMQGCTFVHVCLHAWVYTCTYICVCVSIGRAAGARLGGRGKHTDPFSVNGCHLLNILLFISLEKMTLKLRPSKIYQTWRGNRVYSCEVRGEVMIITLPTTTTTTTLPSTPRHPVTPCLSCHRSSYLKG